VRHTVAALDRERVVELGLHRRLPGLQLAIRGPVRADDGAHEVAIDPWHLRHALPCARLGGQDHRALLAPERPRWTLQIEVAARGVGRVGHAKRGAGPSHRAPSEPLRGCGCGGCGCGLVVGVRMIGRGLVYR